MLMLVPSEMPARPTTSPVGTVVSVILGVGFLVLMLLVLRKMLSRGGSTTTTLPTKQPTLPSQTKVEPALEPSKPKV